MAAGVRVASVSEIPEGSGKTFEIRGKQIAVFHLEDGFYALENVCAECGSSLERSAVTETAVACPHHGWEIDIVEGICPVNPEHQRETYRVRVEKDQIWIDMD